MGRVQTARHDGLIRRLFSIKGGGSQLAETLGDAFPIIPLEGGPIELLKLAGWELGIGGLQAQSAVGTTHAVQLLNPAGSGKIIIPTTCWYALDSASTVFFGVTDVQLAGAATQGRQRDTREGVLAQTAGLIVEGDSAVPPVGAGRLVTEINIPLKLEDSDGLAVLAPGTALTLVSVGTNLTTRVTFIWRERVAEPSELNF